MIRSIDISNFRCIESLNIPDCARVNIIVGDNGVGKTALLEAIFMALGNSPEMAAQLRQRRGLENTFAGSRRRIEDAIWGELFYNFDWTRNVSVRLNGKGPEARSVYIGRTEDDMFIQLPSESEDDSESITLMPIKFVWTDSSGNDYPYYPKITGGNIQMPPSQEFEVPDFFMYSANQSASATENAARFSYLSKKRLADEFLKQFSKTSRQIENLSIEVSGGAPVIHATMQGVSEKIPLNNVSGGLNRIVGILLAMASRRRGIVIVDEIENGLYYKHHKDYWRALLDFSWEYECQLFLACHSKEWLEAMIRVAGKKIGDVSLWRLRRTKSGLTVDQHSGETLAAALEYDEEVR